MKALRRSIKNDKSTESRSSHQSKPSLQNKNPTAIIPPKKVIKALYDYNPTDKKSEVLAFHKGDFFHVISREDDAEWYEACNPLVPSAKGLVPVAFFEVIGKQQRQSSQSVASATAHDSGFSEKGLTAGLLDNKQRSSTDHNITPKSGTMHSRDPSSGRSTAMVYGMVMYDFQAERPDELDAKAGEAIIVVAQSNPEWFVAKPIGRLGGPGLIPVSFVQIRDTLTQDPVADPVAAVKAAGVPKVEEWKKTAAEYKNNSISLGQINTPQIGGVQQVPRGVSRISQNQKQPQMQQIRHQPPPQQSQNKPSQHQQMLTPIKASVPRYCFDNDMYWYIIEAQMSDGRWWELSRYYADFYDFQIALLEKFPEEAGNKGKPRTLPFMPGPVAHVTDAISNGRRQNLDEYIQKIVSLPPHIKDDILVKQLFAPKPNQDYEIDPDAVDDDYRYSGHSLAQTQSRQSSGTGSSHPNSAYGSMPPPPPPPLAMRNINGAHQAKPLQGYGQSAGVGTSSPLHSQISKHIADVADKSNWMDDDNVLIPGLIPKNGQLRIKIEFDDDTFALRIQEEDGCFNRLKGKVRGRLGERVKDDEDISMKYRDDPSGTVVPLLKNPDLKDAVERNVNLRIVVEKKK